MGTLEWAQGEIKDSKARDDHAEEARFNAFMAKVDGCLEAICGLSNMDLPDYCYRDAFEGDEKPSYVAIEVLKYNGFLS